MLEGINWRVGIVITKVYVILFSDNQDHLKDKHRNSKLHMLDIYKTARLLPVVTGCIILDITK